MAASGGKRAYDGYTGLTKPHQAGPPQTKRRAEHDAQDQQQQQWMYVDASEAVQGPFALASMKEWFAQGFLPLETRVRCAAEKEFFTLRQCQEIVGSDRAEPRTAFQWKAAGNKHMAAGRLEKAVDAYGQALNRHDGSSDPSLRSAVLSNRSGAHLLLGNAEAAAADARLCVTARPDWAKAHWRLAVALLSTAESKDWGEGKPDSSVVTMNWRRLSDALSAADKAEKLDPTASHTETKNAALALLRADAVDEILDAAGAAQEQEERTALVKRFRAAHEDTDLRLRCKRVSEQEARDKEAAERGLDGTGDSWRKESAAEYTARRVRLSLLEKIDRSAASVPKLGSIAGEGDERSELEKAEMVDEQLAHSQQHATILRR